MNEPEASSRPCCFDAEQLSSIYVGRAHLSRSLTRHYAKVEFLGKNGADDFGGFEWKGKGFRNFRGEGEGFFGDCRYSFEQVVNRCIWRSGGSIIGECHLKWKRLSHWDLTNVEIIQDGQQVGRVTTRFQWSLGNSDRFGEIEFKGHAIKFLMNFGYRSTLEASRFFRDDAVASLMKLESTDRIFVMALTAWLSTREVYGCE